ncbi:STAM-binding protein-like A [Saccoglossus kowalevskii]|uniref:STAM-binding protein-like A-like n=1 Tax=Saccoglossus kowalevskii TaxID=10224 RepID=A0ABM0H170_SACKO|nr:PREDICTED: STAM-binding protein-like A-like [Saccoglossus kowalevskii]
MSAVDNHDPGERVRALFNAGSKVEVDSNIPVKRYFRSGIEIIRMANVYYEEGELESAFILYSKFITLFVEKLPKHPGYKEATHQDKSVNKTKLKLVFPKAEDVKTRLKKRYENELAIIQEQEKKKQAELAKQQEAERLRKEEEARKREEIRKQLEEEEKKQFEKQKAQILHEDESFIEKEKERQRQIEIDRRLAIELDKENKIAKKPEKQVTPAIVGGTAAVGGGINAAVPSAPPESVVHLPATRPATAPPQGGSSTAWSPYGAVSPSVLNAYNSNFSPPPPPAYASVVSPKGILKEEEPSTIVSVPPSVDRSTKPSTEVENYNNAYGLRQVVVPQEVMVKFLNLALPNTNRNVETCGILAGKLCQNAFLITHVIVPKQSGTSDSCTTVNEEDIFDYQDTHDLITLGWIHTHPSQTAFLSSIDLHTHCGYQLMMPEAIAIVCAPKHQETGIFMLTPSHGLDYIANCRTSGFHPHPKEPPLFENSQHVTITADKGVTLVDLRK